MSAETIAAIEARIAELEARSAVAELVYAYAEAIRLRDPDACRALFMPDAWFEVRHIDPRDPAVDTLVRRTEGVEGIVGSGITATGPNMWPMIHGVRVEVDGDNARASSVLAAAMFPQGRQIIGEYRDEFRRTADGWRFTSRTFRIIGDSTGAYAAEAGC
ncbi:MAG: nuclear transport factor 2 family protein [Novosphingobium sp.]|nr:nuclear transport factor 2 family protein [Novosphingobium sp.]